MGQHIKDVEEHRYLPTELGESSLDTLRSQTKSFDRILKIRLSELSHASSTFMSALIREFRLQIKSDIGQASSTVHDMENDVSMIQKTLQLQRHDPELGIVYILFSLTFLLLGDVYMTLKAVRNSVVNFLCKEIIQIAHMEFFPKPFDPNLPLPSPTSKSILRLKKSKQPSNNLLERNLPLHNLEAF